MNLADMVDMATLVNLVIRVIWVNLEVTVDLVHLGDLVNLVDLVDMATLANLVILMIWVNLEVTLDLVHLDGFGESG